eukprot:CAMPEP_0185186264 /NCGR_PEP_ID=MMETSP1140-20130426/3908_1 /TAXON_ID=298111 /ORGANISM="Pavlova sp., Strain CCMP459" /LENGTH=465 /DNA_ID=CAMNT_0027752533 /DNA_START=143 /DNA_END=1540 /DNA_ORIENTATION=+
MSFNPGGYYTRQEEMDAAASRIDNPNAVGSGYIHFGTMERLPGSEALANNWQFAGGDANAQAPFPAPGAMPTFGAGPPDWSMPAAPRMPQPSPADLSRDWRSGGYEQHPPQGLQSPQAMMPGGTPYGMLPPGAMDPSLAGGMGSLGQPQMPMGGRPDMSMQGAAAQLQNMSLHAPPSQRTGMLASASAAFPSALTAFGSQPSAIDSPAPISFMGTAPMATVAPLAPLASGGASSGLSGPSTAFALPQGGQAPPAPEAVRVAPAGPALPQAAPRQPAFASPASQANGTATMPPSSVMRPPLPAAGCAQVPPTAYTGPQAKSPSAQARATAAPQAAAAGGAKPRTQEDYAAAAKAWKPPKPATISVNPAGASKAVDKPSAAAKPASKAAKEWACKRCSFINHGHMRFCEMCNFDRAGDRDHNSGDDGWHSSSKGGGDYVGQQQQQQQHNKSRASAKNEKRRSKKPHN